MPRPLCQQSLPAPSDRQNQRTLVHKASRSVDIEALYWLTIVVHAARDLHSMSARSGSRTSAPHYMTGRRQKQEINPFVHPGRPPHRPVFSTPLHTLSWAWGLVRPANVFMRIVFPEEGGPSKRVSRPCDARCAGRERLFIDQACNSQTLIESHDNFQCPV